MPATRNRDLRRIRNDDSLFAAERTVRRILVVFARKNIGLVLGLLSLLNNRKGQRRHFYWPRFGARASTITRLSNPNLDVLSKYNLPSECRELISHNLNPDACYLYVGRYTIHVTFPIKDPGNDTTEEARRRRHARIRREDRNKISAQ